MRCIHIYRGTPQLGGIKLHTHFPWFHTAKWGVYRIAPRTVLITRYTHLSGLILGELSQWNRGAPRFRVSPRFTGVCPDKHELTSTIDMVYKRTHTHTHTHTYIHTHTCTYIHIHTHARTHTHRHARVHTRTHTHKYRHILFRICTCTCLHNYL